MKRRTTTITAILSLVLLSRPCVDAQILRGGLLEPSITVQSPEVAAMTSYVDRPVTYFNGTVPLTIPLCEVTADGFTLPVSLTYSNSGFRPSQEATWVGLGWNLSLNACISRCIKCADDFLEYNRVQKGFFRLEQGYYGSAGKTTNEMTRRGLVYKCPVHQLPCGDDIYATDLAVDSEPDIFSLSLWNGTDKFILNDDLSSPVKAIFMDTPAGKVLRIRNTSNNQGRTIHDFEIVNSDGTVYEFRQRELSATLNYPGQRGDIDFHPSDLFSEGDADLNATAWFLTRIIMPSGRSISFKYEEEEFETVTVGTCTRFRTLDGMEQYNRQSELVLPTISGQMRFYQYDAIHSSSKTVIRTARLKEIAWDNCAAKIVFYTSEREDVFHTSGRFQSPHKLDSIKVYDSSGNTVHNYHLIYDYFKGEPVCDDEEYLYKRLKLERVEDMLIPGNNYLFEYDESQPFPSKLTRSVDHWGYWNGKDYGLDYYCQAYDPSTKKLYPGADKSSNFRCTHLGSLTAVVHPTGGRETFEYEQNRFLWPKYVQDGGRQLQTLSMTSLNLPRQHTNELVNTLNFDVPTKITLNGTMVRQSGVTGWSGTLVSITDGYSGRTVNSYYGPVVIQGGDNNIVTLESRQLTLPAGSYSIKVHLPPEGWMSSWQVNVSEVGPVTYRCDMNQTDGAGLRIRRITGGGKTREFSYSLGELLVDPIFSQVKTFSGWTVDVDNYTGNITAMNPYSANCLMQYSESLIPQSTIANSYLLGYSNVIERVTDGNREIATEYRFKLSKETRRSPNPSQSTMPVFSNGLLESRTVSEDGHIVSHEEYTYSVGESAGIRAYDFSQVCGLTTIPNYRFKWYVPTMSGKTTDGVTTLTCYSYNNRWQLSERDVSCRNRSGKIGDFIKEKYLYTYDIEDGICRQMANSNILLPVSERLYVNGGLYSGDTIMYRKENGRFLLDAVSDIRLDDTDSDESDIYRLRTGYDRYDDAGNPIQVTRDGITSLYIWGYRGQYPIAEITGNMSYAQLENRLGGSMLKSMRDSAAPSDAQLRSLESIRSSLYDNFPGTLMTIRQYRPLVGLSSVTAPNGTITKYFYDNGGRLSEVSTSGGGHEQLVGRYSYNMTGGSNSAR